MLVSISIFAVSLGIFALVAKAFADRGLHFTSKTEASVIALVLAVGSYGIGSACSYDVQDTPVEALHSTVTAPKLKPELRKVDLLAIRAAKLAGETREARLRVDGRASATRMNEAMAEARFYSGLQNKTEEIQRRQAHEEEKQTIIEAYLDAVGSGY